MSKISIFVTHTPDKNDFLVRNPLFVNMIAGADYQTKPIPEEMTPDNTGDNISLKNRSYCELTTQYWAWKNAEADYYGFCHYRRFFTLSEKIVTDRKLVSKRRHINCEVLSRDSVRAFGLDDAAGMERFVEGYDVILPLEQDLSILETPIGRQPNVYRHFAAHNRLFMHAPDLKVMMEVLQEKFPEYAADAEAYLKQKGFWGFNCFVARKKYFRQLCEFEFPILEEVEKRLNTRLYNRQASRVYGFLAEILSAIFFYHLKKTVPGLKVRESQLIYFDHAEARDPMIPACGPETVPVLLYYGDEEREKIKGFLPEQAVRTFLETKTPGRAYELILLHFGLAPQYLKYYQKLCEEAGGVSFRNIDLRLERKALEDVGYEPADSRLLLPWILENYDRALYVNWNSLFRKPVDELLDMDPGDDFAAGPCDVLRIGQIRAVDGKYEKYLRSVSAVRSFEKMISENLHLLNLKKIREEFRREDVLIPRDTEAQLDYFEKLNDLFLGHTRILPQTWDYYYTQDGGEKQEINQIPLYLINEYQAAEKEASVVTYDPYVIWESDGSEFGCMFWERARASGFYHLYIDTLGHSKGKLERKSAWLLRKVNGGLKCVEDHGLSYTVQYSVKKGVGKVAKKIQGRR